MLFYILAIIAALLAVLLWFHQAAPTQEKPAAPEIPPPEIPPQLSETIAAAVRSLRTVMEHPELGGPGFLLVEFPSQGSGETVTVTAQYPNIREALYRRIVRRELDPASLVEAGIPETVMSMNPTFETESGGVVLLSVQAEGLPPALSQALTCRRERTALLSTLSETLGERFPDCSVRVFGADLLLTPERAETR